LKKTKTFRLKARKIKKLYESVYL